MMPGTANVYDTPTFVTATPAFAAPAIIATIPSVSTGQNFGRVRLFAALTFTEGADTTAVTLRWYRNLIAANVPAGPAFTVASGAAAVNLVCAGDENPPPGTHSYNLYITQTDASAGGTVGALVAYAIVGG